MGNNLYSNRYYNNGNRPSTSNSSHSGSNGYRSANNNYRSSSYSEEGRGAAIASLVLGICSLVMMVFGLLRFFGVIAAIVGLITAGSAKSSGYQGGMRTAGFVLSVITLSLVAVAILGYLGIYACACSTLGSLV